MAAEHAILRGTRLGARDYSRPMRPTDARLERLLGDGAAAFRATFDLVPDPVGVLWAVRDEDGAVIDF